MKRAFSAVLLLGVALGIGAGGYWFGHRNAGSNSQMSTTAATEPAPVPASGSSPERQILYYRDPMGKPDYSPAPKKDSMGMDYIPVYDDEATGVPPSQATAKQQGKGKLLYYRNPMAAAQSRSARPGCRCSVCAANRPKCAIWPARSEPLARCSQTSASSSSSTPNSRVGSRNCASTPPANQCDGASR